MSETKPFLAISNQGLEAKNISKFYDKKRILNDISLILKKGESVAILGPNGAGKTTLFHIIMGLIKTDLGSISLDEKNITNLPMYRRAKLGIGYLPQESSIFRGLNVEENIKSILQVTYNNKSTQNQLHKKDKSNSIAQIQSKIDYTKSTQNRPHKINSKSITQNQLKIGYTKSIQNQLHKGKSNSIAQI